MDLTTAKTVHSYIDRCAIDKKNKRLTICQKY